MPKRKSKKASPPPGLERAVRSLLSALQGAPFTGAIAQPQAMLSSLSAMRAARYSKSERVVRVKFKRVTVPATAKVNTTVRAVENEGCEKQADIVALYQNFLNPGDQPIGEDAVTTILNNAAAQRCADELQCPKGCPASFTRQKKLYEYMYATSTGDPRTFEYGVLTYDQREWNCRCAKSDIEDIED